MMSVGLWKPHFAIAVLIAASCANLTPSGQTIFDSSIATVKLQTIESMPSSSEAVRNAHPVTLSQEHVRILLASISARPKVGFLRSLAGEPGAPRLFDREQLDLLARPIQEALAQATSHEEIVFYVTTQEHGIRAQATSGKLFVREALLYLTIFNFRYPLVMSQSEVGSSDRLDDVRETAAYVRDHPTSSVGEQDFVIFFDDPHFQMEQRGIELFGYPERTLAIAYRPFLAANPSLRKREAEIQEAVQHATMGKGERQAIADLKRRVAELEQMNRTLSNTPADGARSASEPIPTSLSSFPDDASANSQEKLLNAVKRLEERIIGLEEQLKRTPTRSNKQGH